MENKISRIRPTYLYLASMIGLILVVMSLITFIELGLKVTIFTKADLNYYTSAPYAERVSKDRVQNVDDNKSLTAEQKQTVDDILKEYNNPINQSDYLVGQRQSDAVGAIAMFIIGLLLYIYHWRIIQRDHKREGVAAKA